MPTTSIFADVTVDLLEDDRRLLAWFHRAAAAENPIVNGSDADLLYVFSAAQRALEVGDDPEYVFPAFFRRNREIGHYITQKQEARARHRLRRMRDADRPRSDSAEPLHGSDAIKQLTEKW